MTEGHDRAGTILVEGLTRRFGRREILHHLDLRVDAGDFLLVLGANGAGKTTLLRILATLLRPHAGSVFVAGVDACEEPAAVRPVVGFVGHAPLLYRDLTVRENLRFYAAMYGLSEPDARISGLLDRFELSPRRDDRVGELSRGMRQRAAIARALLHRPSILLLDEPYATLDERARGFLDGVFEDEAGRTTVVLTTHEPERPSQWATATVLLEDGRALPIDHAPARRPA